MNKEEISKPTQAELTVLRILWDKGLCSVKIAHEVISLQKETGYTTTLKIMQNMLEKGLVLRTGIGTRYNRRKRQLFPPSGRNSSKFGQSFSGI